MTEPDAQPAHQASLQFERLAFFSDAVFAIAITLLVLDLRLPTAVRGPIDLSIIGPKLFGFALSFAVIGVYWMHHHALFGTIRREDPPLVVTNLAYLASIVFLPFPTSVIAEYPATTGSVVFYALSVAAVGLMAALLSWVARRPHLRLPEETGAGTARFVINSLPTPVIFLISAGVALVRPRLAMELWWLIGPTVWLVRRLSRRFGDPKAGGGS